MSNRDRLASAWLPVVLWMAVIFIVSAQPQLPSTRETWLDLIIYTAGHVAEYTILGALVARGTELSGLPLHRRNRLLLILACTLYGVSDEFHQLYVPGRVADVWDVTVDVLGAIIGVELMALSTRSHTRLPRE